ncbi:MAG: response regulator transcription factor [Bacillota bacterium]
MYNVILVDDMDISRRHIARMNLWNEGTGFRIAAEARNGQDALDILRSRQMDLLITDIKMPKIDGIELLKEVTANKLCPCVVLMSDYEDFAYAKQGIQYGAFDYLNKPVNHNEMASMLERVREFLLQKKKESEFVRSLKSGLEEKLKDHLPVVELEQLIDAFKVKSPDVMKIAGRLTDAIEAVFGDNIIMTGIIFKRTMAELTRQLAMVYQWMEKFIDVQKYKGIDFADMGSAREAAEAFQASVRELFGRIAELEYGSNKEQIENRISRLVLETVDDKVSIEGISRSLYMNRKYLSEVFKQKTGELLIEYITRIKMKRASRLLDQGGLKTYEVALMMGFKDTEYFSRIFKRYMGISPSGYRDNMGI